jgi:hypothetical protein
MAEGPVQGVPMRTQKLHECFRTYVSSEQENTNIVFCNSLIIQTNSIIYIYLRAFSAAPKNNYKISTTKQTHIHKQTQEYIENL